MMRNRLHSRSNKKSVLVLKAVVAALIILATFTGKGFAQSSSQVTIVGIPPVLSTPFADDIERNFRSGQYQVIFNYSSFIPQPVDFVFDFVLTKNNQTIIELTSEPRPFTPGSYIFTSFFEEVIFLQDPQEILNSLSSDLRNQLIQSGAIPEGNFTIEITARPFSQQAGISSVPGRVMFNVRYPSPPILVSVPDQSNVMFDNPVFSWTPVVSSLGGLFEYEFLLVEVRRGQTPLQAIESNREHALVRLVGQSTLPYTLEYLPLDEGALYAWRVTAKDATGNIPLRNNGESDIYTFTFRDRSATVAVTETIKNLERISLVPGFAELTDFDNLMVEETPISYVIDGMAVLNLNFASAGEFQFRALLDRVEIQKTNLQNPILMGGSLEAQARGLEELTTPLSDLVNLEKIMWSFGSGLTADLRLILPESSGIQAEGQMAIQPTGLNGMVSARGSPVISMGEYPLQVDVTEVNVRFPEGTVSAATDARFFGEQLCQVPDFSLYNDDFRILIDCDAEKIIPMVDGSENLLLNISKVSGMIAGSWQNQEIDFGMSLKSDINFLLSNDQYCGASSTIVLSSEDGIVAEDFTPSCSFPRPAIDLGFLHATISDINISNIGLSDAGNSLDFEIEFDSQLFFPTNPDLSLPKMEGITISNNGITFPEIEFHSGELPINNTFNIGEFEFDLKRFELENFTFPWFNWGGDGPGPWSFSFDADLNLPFSANVPGCFSSSALSVNNASVSGDGQGGLAVMGAFSADDIADCNWDIGPGYALQVNSFEGLAVITYEQDDFQLQTDFLVDAELTVGEPFACGTDPVIDLSGLSLTLREGLNGTITGLEPGCPIEIGPYTGTITDAGLSFSYSPDSGQSVILSGGAQLELSDEQSANGTFSINLVTGELSDVMFNLEGPFEWGIPKENPILAFTINQATISDDGLFIDGRQQLNLGSETIGTTFDNLLINWQTYEIKSGRIIFDHGFSFIAGVDSELGTLSIQSATSDSTLNLSPAVLMQLAGTVQIDSLGLKTSGSASAEIHINDLQIGDLEVEYSDDFSFELQPFGIQEGEAEFYWNGNRIAFANNSGFYPDFGFFAEEFLPEIIPLPTEEVAYLRIRDDEGTLIVNTTQLGNGLYQIDTIEGESLNLVLPVLQRPDEAVPPEVQVQLNELVVNPSSGAYVSGTVTALISGESPLRNSPNLPVELNEIVYSTGTNGYGQEIHALFVSGSLKLFEQTLGEEQLVTLYIQSDGIARGAFILPDVGAQIPLDGDGGRVVLAVDSVSGVFDWNPANTAVSEFDFNINGGFQINNIDGEAIVRSDLGISYNRFGLSVTDFSPGDLLEQVPLDFGFINLKIPEIESLVLSYDRNTGFDYYADLDILFELVIDDRTIPFPLKNVEIRKDLGIVIPSQDIHEGSVPGLNMPEFNFGVFNLKPLAFRMPRDTINWNNWSPGDLLDIIPNIDFELSFPQLESRSPELAALSITLSDATFSEGVINGELLPLDLSETPISLPIGSGAFNITEIAGSLYNNSPQQMFSVELSGDFDLPDFFGDGEDCSQSGFTVNLDRAGMISGSVSGFTPCGEIGIGPISLGFGESGLEFTVTEEEQAVILSGEAIARIQTDGGAQVDATGALVYDLMNNRILDGSLSVTSEFPWHFPSSDSLFNFRVESATLSSEGLIFDAGGELVLGDGTVSVDFQNMTFDLSTGALIDGSAEFTNEFAFDIAFAPTRWSVSNPSVSPEFEQGVRLTVPGNVNLSANGMLVNGSSNAALYFGEEQYDQLSVNFVDARFDFEGGARISEGRADLILTEEGQDSTRLGWYDVNGFHVDNILAAVSFPNILPLPDMDTAYLILRDEEGNNLVESEATDQGLSIYTTAPINLVITAFQDDYDIYTIPVEFDAIVINASGEMVSGSIIADISETPLNLSTETDFPFGITALSYVREEGNNKLYADAVVMLPEALGDIQIDVSQIELGPNGFKNALVTAGQYTETYNSENSEIVVSHSFSDGALEMIVRGVKLQFGDSPSYKFSGEITSNFLRDDEGGLAPLFLSAAYEDSGWEFITSAQHLVPQSLPIGLAEFILEDLSTAISADEFAVIIDGRISFEDILGPSSDIGIDGLRIGTNGVSIANIDTEALAPQTLSLFGQQDNLQLNALGLELTDESHLILTLDGSFSFLDRSFSISGMRIGSDGTFALGDGSVNLLGDSPVELLSSNLVLTTLQIGLSDNQATLTALADLTLPEPVETNSTVGFSVSSSGVVTVQQPDINFSGVSQEIPGIGTVSLTDIGFEINDLQAMDFAIYAMAKFEAGNGSVEFGQAGSADNWGLRYQYGGSLQWRITNEPNFTFSNEMFSFAISSAQIADLEDAAFGLNFSVGASLTLEGISGSIGFQNMIISSNGLESLGTFNNASLGIGPASVSISSFEYAQNGGTLSLEQEAAGSSNANPESEIVEIQTLEHLSFGGTFDIPGFSGGVERVLYYRTSDEIFFSIQKFSVEFNSMAGLEASIEYRNLGGNNFSLMVAGSAFYEPPQGGTSYGMAAYGRMEHIDGDFSFGIFVKLDAEVPIIPGIISMTSFGGGFFYNAKPDDFNNVLALTNYELTNPLAPWEEESSGYDFAIVLYAGVGLIGEGVYVIDGDALLMITPDWIALDVSATVFDGAAAIDAGMYLAVEWKTGVRVTGGVMATIDNAIMYGVIEMHFQVVNNNGQTVWAIHGGIDDLDVLSIFKARSTIIIGPDGFYFDVTMSYNFDISIIKAFAEINGAIWWIFDQQFGAFVEFTAEVSLFKGVFKGGGNFKGALLIESGSYLVYATATLYVDILVFTGYTNAWVSVKDGKIDGGRGGSDEYDNLIASAQAEAQQMNSSMNDALNAAQNFVPLPELLFRSEAEIAQAGEAIIGNNALRWFIFTAMIFKEKQLTGTTPELYQTIVDAFAELGNLPTRNDYSINSHRTAMNEATSQLADKAQDVMQSLADVRSSAVQWRELAQQSLDQLIQSPVQSVQTQWVGDIPPGFSIDSSIDEANQEHLAEYMADVYLLDEQFKAAIDSIYSNIAKLELAMSPQGADINGISEQFTQTVSAVDRFYANLGGMYWDINRWARNGSSMFNNLGFDLEEAVIQTSEQMLAGAGVNFSYSNMQLGSTNFNNVPLNKITDIAAHRGALLTMFTDNTDGYNEDLSAEKSTFNNWLSNNDYLSYFSNFVIKGIEFWYQMPTLGYDALIQSSQERAEQIYVNYEENLEDLKGAHVQFTNAVDDVYSIQHAIYVTLEEVLRQYVNWSSDIFGESYAAEYENLKAEVKQIALPPTIGAITGNATRNNFVTTYNIGWNVSHPTGQVVESSYYLNDNSDSSIFDNQFTSVGNNTSVTRYLTKRTYFESQRSFGTRVRARGPSGISIRRLQQLSVGLNPPAPSSNNPFLNFRFDSREIFTMITPASPPETPTVSFNYNDVTSTSWQYTGNMQMSQVSSTTYWSNSTNSLEFIAYSYDNVNDIAYFEFMIGTSPGDSSVVGWTQQSGIPVNGSATNEQFYSVGNLSLQTGTNYYVTVRATNGAGVKSEPASGGPVRIDTSAPGTPLAMDNSITLPTPVKIDPATSNNAAINNVTTWTAAPNLPVQSPTVTLRWSGAPNAGASGFDMYQIVASTISNANQAFNSGNVIEHKSTNRVKTITGGNLNFTDEFYFHIRTKDNAGNFSNTLTLGPVQITDPTSPSTPSIVARAMNSQVGFYLTRPSADPETGIQGYAYQFINLNTGSAIVRASGFVTVTNQGRAGKPTFVSLPTADVPKGVPLRIRVVAVNNQGIASNDAVSQTIYHDTTIPLSPTASVTQNGDKLDISISNIHDPESGIRLVQYRVVNLAGTQLQGWTNFINISGIARTPRSGNRSYTMQGTTAANTRIIVRIRNGNGMERELTLTPVVQILTLDQQAINNQTFIPNW